MQSPDPASIQEGRRSKCDTNPKLSMITNFQAQTAPLTKKEIWIAGLIATLLKQTSGPGHILSNRKIRTQLYKSHDIELSSVRIRKIINYIRLTGMVDGLVANNVGYYVTRDTNEMKRYCISLSERIGAIQCVLNASLGYLERINPPAQ
jgi:carbamoylphosphate synthase small subunit